jgi:SNF2 family DNA or RNA helicase
MNVVEDVAVQLTLRNEVAAQVLNLIEKSEVVGEAPGQRDVMVYWGQDEMERLAHIMDNTPMVSNKVPSPMTRDYTWPGLFKPFDHQKVTAAFLSVRKRAFCFNEAGTGKTSAAIWAADYLMNLGLVKRVLIICPLSIMYSAWRDEVFKAAMHRTCGVAHGSKDKRVKVINNEYEFVVINFDGVEIVANEIANAGFDLIIVDEANAYKTATTKRWKTLAKLITPDTRLWMMTGTPASQSPLDAFGLAKMVSPHRVPKFSTAWRDKVLTSITRFKWIPRPDAKDIVYAALQPAVRFTKEECLDLPPLTHQVRDVPLTPQVLRYYKLLKQQMQMEAAGEQVSAVNAAASLNKLLQISGGAVYTDKRDTVVFDVAPRLKELKSVLEETERKVVVFVPFLHTIEVVEEYLRNEGYVCEVINGNVSAKNRADIIGRFQTQTDPRVLVIQPQSASHGVTLTEADTIVFWSPVMSVETYIQCIGRIDRVGQQHKMTVIHLQGSDVERRVYAMLQGKVDSHNKIVDLYKQEMESL